jgi:L-rhamnose-H+ transport protein
MSDNFWRGMLVICASAIANGGFTLPMKCSRTWRWENTWLLFSFLFLLVLPWSLAVRYVPDLLTVYRTSGGSLLYPLAFGFLWGITYVAFGLSVNSVGMAVAFAVTMGLNSLVGSLVPLFVFDSSGLVHRQGRILLISMPFLLIGLLLYGVAGRQREKEQPGAGLAEGAARGSFGKGLALSVFSGVFGSSFNLGFAFSGDIIRHSHELGASTIASTYAAWALVLSAGFIPNLVYCSYLLNRNCTWSFFYRSRPWIDAIFAITMALLGITAFLGYGFGATLIGKYGTSLGFALFIAASILVSNSIGLLTGEWKATSARTRTILAAGIVTILISVVILNLGGIH